MQWSYLTQILHLDWDEIKNVRCPKLKTYIGRFSEALDFGPPSGALEDGARGHIIGVLAVKFTLEMPFLMGTVLVSCF